MTSITKIQCWCCGNPSGRHKMSCNVKSKVETLEWFLSELYLVPDDVLDYVSHKIYVESLERKLRFDEYVEASQELEIKHDNAKRD